MRVRPAAFRVGLDAGEFRRILADAVGTGGALDVGVVALSREDPLGGEACFLELPVGVGGDDEVVAPARPVVQLAVQGRGLHPQIVHSGMVRPIGPAVLFRSEGVEAGGVHVGHAVALDEGFEVVLEALAAVVDARRRGKPRPGADEHPIGRASTSRASSMARSRSSGDWRWLR